MNEVQALTSTISSAGCFSLRLTLLAPPPNSHSPLGAIERKMKKILVITAIAFVFGIGYYVYQIWGFAIGVNEDAKRMKIWREDNISIYYIDVPTSLDIIAFQAEIRLQPDKRIHQLKLPNGGTETNISIYDSTYLTKLGNNIQIGKLKSGDFTKDEQVILDITSLSKGKYYVHYLSCGFGGVFPLTIE